MIAYNDIFIYSIVCTLIIDIIKYFEYNAEEVKGYIQLCSEVIFYKNLLKTTCSASEIVDNNVYDTSIIAWTATTADLGILFWYESDH